MSSKGKSWTTAEINLMRRYYTSDINRLCELLPRRTRASIHVRAFNLGLKNRGINKSGNRLNQAAKIMPWSEKEIALLRKYYADDFNRLCELLPGRSKSAIMQCASHLKIKKNVYRLVKTIEDVQSKLSKKEILERRLSEVEDAMFNGLEIGISISNLTRERNELLVKIDNEDHPCHLGERVVTVCFNDLTE